MLIRINESFDEDGVEYRENAVTQRRPTKWTLVKRVSDEFVDDGLADLLAPTSSPIARVPAGQSCPQSGWWFTPAKTGSRRRFKAEEIFPLVEGSDYGATFWLWDETNSDERSFDHKSVDLDADRY